MDFLNATGRVLKGARNRLLTRGSEDESAGLPAVRRPRMAYFDRASSSLMYLARTFVSW
jgi:hypothetical protein